MGVTDSAPALAAVVAEAPASVVADGQTLDYVEYDTSQISVGLWEGTASYSHKSSNRSESQNERLSEVDDVETTFDFAGQTVRITEAINQTGYAPAGEGVIDFGDSINVTDDGGPEGVDIEIVSGIITKTKVFDAATVTDAWVKARSQMVGKVNHAAYFSGAFDAGELLLSRFSGRQRGSAGDWHVTYSFKVGENETGIEIAGITGIDKGGFDYVWVRYDQEEDTTENAMVSKARGVYVAEVYKEADFSTLGL